MGFRPQRAGQAAVGGTCDGGEGSSDGKSGLGQTLCSPWSTWSVSGQGIHTNPPSQHPKADSAPSAVTSAEALTFSTKGCQNSPRMGLNPVLRHRVPITNVKPVLVSSRLRGGINN